MRFCSTRTQIGTRGGQWGNLPSKVRTNVSKAATVSSLSERWISLGSNLGGMSCNHAESATTASSLKRHRKALIRCAVAAWRCTMPMSSWNSAELQPTFDTSMLSKWHDAWGCRPKAAARAAQKSAGLVPG